MSECIVWTGRTNNGYGVSYDRGRTYAHRAAFASAHGAIPAGHDVHHKCGNKLCVNPAHLESIPSAEHRRAACRESVRRAIASRVARQLARTECRKGHDYARHGYLSARGWRFCRACARERNVSRTASA